MLLLKMNAVRFIQIHILVSAFATNRNENGLLKDLHLGGYLRTRRSSQSVKFDKRYCRDPEIGLASITVDGKLAMQTLPSRGHFEDVFHSLDNLPGDPRAKLNIVQSLYETFVGKANADKKRNDKLDKTREQLTYLQEQLAGKKKEHDGLTDGKAKTASAKTIVSLEKKIDSTRDALHKAGIDVGMADEERVASDKSVVYDETAQVIALSQVEVDDILKPVAADALAEVVSKNIAVSNVSDAVKTAVARWRSTKGKEFAKLRLGSGIQGAVFGRPSWGGGLTQPCLAAVNVAHQFTTHVQRVNWDTFTARDVLKGEDSMGAGMLGELPLSHGIFYGYELIHTQQLIENIERTRKDSDISAEIVKRLILMTSRLSTRTKEGSLAPKSTAMLVMVEVGNSQPQSLGDAFIEPIGVDPEHPNMAVNAIDRLADYIQENDAAHPTTNKRAVMLVEPHKTRMLSVVPSIMSDIDLAQWAVHTANGEAFAPSYVLAPPPAPQPKAHVNGHTNGTQAPPVPTTTSNQPGA